MLYIIFAVVALGFFPYYKKIMIFVNGELSDYYIAVLLQGFIKGEFLTEHAGIIYNAVIFLMMYLAGYLCLYTLSVFKLSRNISLLISFFYMFSFFSLTIAFTHPDIIVLMMIIPVIACCIHDIAGNYRKSEGKGYMMAGIVFGVCMLPFAAVLLKRVLSGNAVAYVSNVIQRMDKEEYMYLIAALVLFAGFVIVSLKTGANGRGWLYVGMAILLMYSYLIAFNEYSPFKNFVIDTDYISYVNVKGSMDGIKEGLPGGINTGFIPMGIILCILYMICREYISRKEKTEKQA